MNQQRLMQVLLAPQISEKATYVADKNEQVIFRVVSDATKPEVKAAVEGDALFPHFSSEPFREISRTPYPADAENEYSFDLVRYRREPNQPKTNF